MKRAKNFKLTRNKRAVSAVVSNMILIAAVITIGLIALAWSQNQSATYQKTQGAVINDKIYQLKERLSLEYINYTTAGTLKIYVINTGLVNVTISGLYLSDSPATSLSFQAKEIVGGTIISPPRFGTAANKEGYIEVAHSLTFGNSYSATIITQGGSTFVYTFAT